MDANALLLTQAHQLPAALVFGLLGLLIGSFLNVVIYRMPVMMHNHWQAECAELKEQELPSKPRFNLMVPRSRCPHCEHTLLWTENIPVLSYLLQGGRCKHCQAAISKRYPLVESITALLFAACAWRYGLNSSAWLWAGFCATLLALALIDWDTTLLPDDLTLPLLWAGLIAAATTMTPVALQDAVWGAVFGYGSLWSIYWAFKLATGKEGMGFGDFKLLGALGAWFGWQALIPILLMASLIGAVVGIALKFSSGLREGGYVPFGPFLAGAGFMIWLFGPQTIMQTIGL
jgi:leader peptidase (prepilin peptidase)/N-methyltransferase